MIFSNSSKTKSQTVARTADRTASQHLWGHVMLSATWPFDTHHTPHAISYWWSFDTESLSQAVFDILHTTRIRVTSLTFHGHVMSSVTWPFDSQVAISYRHSIVSKCVYPAISEILGPKHIGVTTLTFQVMSSFIWPFDSQVAISYRHSIVTKSVSPAVFEILGIKHIGVTTLTFLGQVTSSVTWPFDSQVATSYRQSIVTIIIVAKSLSLLL